MEINKRGQLTVFIILGIIFVIFFSMISYVNNEVDLKSDNKLVIDFNNQADSFHNYILNCFKQQTKLALNEYGNDYFFVKQYLLTNGLVCFNEDLFPNLIIEISPPLYFEIENNEDNQYFKITLDTKISLQENSKEYSTYEFFLEKSQTEQVKEHEINVDGNLFLYSSPRIINKEEVIEDEAIIRYNSIIDNEDEFIDTLLSLDIIERKRVVYENQLDMGIYPELKELILSLSLDEKIIFDNSKITFSELKEKLEEFDFITEVVQNKNSFVNQLNQIRAPLRRERRYRRIEFFKRLRESYSVDSGDEFFNYQWYLENQGQFFGVEDADIDINGAWNISKGTATSIISVIDEGIFSNPDLDDNIINSRSYNFVNNNYDISPKTYNEYHGTHVAGVIISNVDNGYGIAGVCPNCQVINMKVMDEYNGVDTQTLVNAVLLSVSNGAEIISMSLGGSEYSSYEDYVFTELTKQGIIFVGASGNDGTYEKSYPAGYNSVIAVGATDNTDSIASFSNRGSWVDIYAPGEQIISSCGYSKYCFSSGTSMATPIVSGVIGLMKSMRKDLSKDEALSILKMSSDQLYDGNLRLNAKQALELMR